jgi:FKBP-type peptidyl-prolyl cis-trans isomerase FkpA
MTRQFVATAIVGLAAGIVCGCGASAPVNENSDSQPSAAAEVRKPDPYMEPGPKDPDAPTEFTTTESGLKYRVLRKGTGPVPTKSNRVLVNYKGWLDDGKVFDQSYGKGPFEFGLEGEVIEGWNEGVTHVGQGGMIELEIPSTLGYGEAGYPGAIPPNATLHFEIEVIEVK